MVWYLYDHPNPHAPVRSNGVRFWGYPQRQARVRVLVVHTAENTPDTVARDGGAEAVAAHQAATSRPSSYHCLVDSDSTVHMLPPDAVAFGARGANADGWHLSFATKAALWSALPDRWVDRAIERGAVELAAAARLFGVPLRRITAAQRAAGQSGVMAHADVDPDRRSDPGARFPWAALLGRARAILEDDMAHISEDNQRFLNDMVNRLREIETSFAGPAYAVLLVRELGRQLGIPGNEPAKIAEALLERGLTVADGDERYAPKSHPHRVV